MNNPDDAPEEVKKIVVKPKHFRERAPKTSETLEPAPKPAPGDDFFEELPNPITVTRKRPSPALRSAESLNSPSKSEDQVPSPAQVSTSSGSAEKPQNETRRFSRDKRSKQGLRTPIPLGLALVLAIVLCVLAGFFSYSAGSRAGFQEAEAAAIKENVELTPEFLARLDRALVSLQTGVADTALSELKALQAEEPDVATLSLLVANAALLSNQSTEASQHIAESIARRESVSDALTLQAIVEAKLATDSEYKKMGSPKVRIEQLL
ncbi:MAG: hypothetical protein ACKOAS_00240, partial [Verrucomicrobiota bacterium]